jgi:hypothetical protein
MPGMTFAVATRMRTSKLMLFTTACLSMFGACVASVEDDAAPAVGDVESALGPTEVVPAINCPDLVARVPYSEDCTTPRGDGTRQCTTTLTTHRFIASSPTGPVCRSGSTTSTTSCGFCVVPELPDPF